MSSRLFLSLIHGLREFGRVLIRPVTTEFPLFFISVLMLDGVSVVQNIHCNMVTPSEMFSACWIFNRLSLVCLYSYALACVACWARKWPVKALCYAVVLTLTTIDRFVQFNFMSHISPETIRLMAETNGRATSEFLHTFMSTAPSRQALVMTLPYLMLITVGEWWRKRLATFLSGRIIKFLLIVFLLPLMCNGVCGLKVFATLAQVETTDDLSRWLQKNMVYYDAISHCIYSFAGVEVAARDMRKAIASTRRGLEHEQVTLTQSDSLHLVLVIGESHIKWHSSLYGYEHETNPLLKSEQKRGNLSIFDNVISPYNQTSSVLKNILCCNDIASGERWFQFPFLPAIFKRAGYRVTMCDNQREMFVGAVFSFALNSFLYDPYIQEVSYDVVNTHSKPYDGDMVKELAQQWIDSSAPSFTIIHLQGQHHDARERFPADGRYRVFTADSVLRNEHYITAEKRQKIADYDNAMRYNDEVLHAIYDLYRDKNAVVVYVADHGEEIFDFRDSMGRKLDERITSLYAKYQFEIPFMIWCSDRYRNTHANEMTAIAEASVRPFTSGRLCHLLLHLGHVSTRFYRAERDVLSPEYECGRRVINGHLDYDSIVGRAMTEGREIRPH